MRVAAMAVAAMIVLPRPAFPETETAAPECAARAALYTSDKGLKVWVTRRGVMTLGENPLRPLSRDEVVVLQVVVNGRLATAWGPDYANLRQGGAPRDLEREGARPIRWDAEATAYPEAIRVVAEDGHLLFGPMRFAECGDAPAAQAVAAPVRRPDRPAAARPAREGPSRDPVRGLPQGAIPSLTLPRAPVD